MGELWEHVALQVLSKCQVAHVHLEQSHALVAAWRKHDGQSCSEELQQSLLPGCLLSQAVCSARLSQLCTRLKLIDHWLMGMLSQATACCSMSREVYVLALMRCRLHAGGLLGGVLASIIILVWYGIRGVFSRRRTTTASS